MINENALVTRLDSWEIVWFVPILAPESLSKRALIKISGKIFQ